MHSIRPRTQGGHESASERRKLPLPTLFLSRDFPPPYCTLLIGLRRSVSNSVGNLDQRSRERTIQQQRTVPKYRTYPDTRKYLVCFGRRIWTVPDYVLLASLVAPSRSNIIDTHLFLYFSFLYIALTALYLSVGKKSSSRLVIHWKRTEREMEDRKKNEKKGRKVFLCGCIIILCRCSCCKDLRGVSGLKGPKKWVGGNIGKNHM